MQRMASINAMIGINRPAPQLILREHMHLYNWNLTWTAWAMCHRPSDVREKRLRRR